MYALERLGLFDRVEVFALNVFDDRQLGHLPVVDLADQDGHLPPIGGLGGTQAALAGDQFVVRHQPAARPAAAECRGRECCRPDRRSRLRRMFGAVGTGCG